jgi:hypothetical protein
MRVTDMKAKTTTKPAVTAVTVTRARGAAKPAAASSSVKYFLSTIARPVSGPRLYAHTMAVLVAFGMFRKGRPAVARHLLVQTMGERAVRYHSQTMHSMEGTDKLRLTTDGADFFTQRADAGRLDSELVGAFTAMLLEGKESDTHKVYARHINAISGVAA